MPSSPDRRAFVRSAAGAVLAAPLLALPPRALRAAIELAAGPRLRADPFTLGVASGDPAPDGVVIWTRLAPDPLGAPLGSGGMPARDVPVRWEVAADDAMRRVVRSGVTAARADAAHSVHVEVEGLLPNRVYWYRFRTAEAASPVGRARTAPAPNARVDALAFAFASCQRWQAGRYPAYRHLAEQELDLVLHLGDYIYESAIPAGDGPRAPDAGRLAADARAEPTTLGAYRARHALYRLDPDLQAAHAACAWAVTWDDHEVENNWAGEHDEHDSPRDTFFRRRAAAFQAYYEHMPLRRAARPAGPDLRLYRRLAYGDLAAFNVLDTRQYRSEHACGDGRVPRCPPALDPARTMLGAAQERWLLDGLAASRARWNVLAQQVIMAQLDYAPGADGVYSMDKWDGYAASRRRLLGALAAGRVANPVVLAGDAHITLVSDLVADFDRPGSAPIATEFAGTAITSPGPGPGEDRALVASCAEHPHVKFYDGVRRGYVRCAVTREAWRADLMYADGVERRDAPVRVGATWVVENGRAGAVRG